ncbi:MAG: hydrogen peroxide-dependent heme synthase, partial [Actinomycetota bacterium]
FYPVFRRAREIFVSVDEAVHEWEVAFKQVAGSVSVRGFYSSVGFRPDADFMMWLVSSSADDLQTLAASLRRTALGRSLELTHSFLGAVRPPEFNPQHQPAFLRGEGPGRYLCVYPFVRTPEWYLLPSEERSRLLREHGEMGREFPDVLPNTTSAFGLTDWEWILAFEADELHRIVDCIRRLRDSESRRYVKEEVPFVMGIRKPLAEAMADLV